MSYKNLNQIGTGCNYPSIEPSGEIHQGTKECFNLTLFDEVAEETYGN